MLDATTLGQIPPATKGDFVRHAALLQCSRHHRCVPSAQPLCLIRVCAYSAALPRLIITCIWCSAVVTIYFSSHSFCMEDCMKKYIYTMDVHLFVLKWSKQSKREWARERGKWLETYTHFPSLFILFRSYSITCLIPAQAYDPVIIF